MAFSLTALLVACIPGTRATRAELDAVERRTLPAISEATAPVSYLRAGDPALRRVIYVHGTPGTARSLGDYLAWPVDGLEAVAVDRLGFGESGPGRVVAGFREQAASIAPLLVGRGGRWPILVGHSLGGPIICRLAAENPDRVAGLVILSGSLDPTLEGTNFLNRLGDTAFGRLVLPRTLETANSELLAARAELEALAPMLADVRCPILVVHGTDDWLVPFRNVAYMRRAFAGNPRVDFIGLRGAGHLIPWQREDEVRAAVERMRDEVEGTGP